jgi:hypothetical protein
MNPIQMAGRFFFGRSLENTGPALTFARLCTSRHLADLQLIAFVVLLIIVIVLPVDLSLSGSRFLGTDLPIASALLAAAAAVLSWLYQTGSVRIGAVDLFACEITAICRVCLVADFAENSVRLAESKIAEAARPRKFSSQEGYTPVYDSKLADLQPLDVNVVTSVTEFYTYRKTMVDYLRSIAEAEDPVVLRGLRVQMIYMQFLMYESARRSIDALIEFEPNRAEAYVNILCSELPTYSFLMRTFAEGDFRGARLRLRAHDYDNVVRDLAASIPADDPAPHWERARTTLPELMTRYHAMRASLSAPATTAAAAQ